jgi:hypothetical protein
MKRCSVIGVTLVVSLAMLIPAGLWYAMTEGFTCCSSQGGPRDSLALNVQAVPDDLKDPLEKDRTVRELMSPGHWQARGRDELGRQFEGYLVVDRSPGAYLRAGYFEWQAPVGGGRYHFEGTFDPATRMVRWTGYSVQDRFGGAVSAHYEAKLSADGRRFENGTWSGGISIPGTWTADYIGE